MLEFRVFVAFAIQLKPKNLNRKCEDIISIAQKRSIMVESLFKCSENIEPDLAEFQKISSKLEVSIYLRGLVQCN